jgi:hypothetical protein
MLTREEALTGAHEPPPSQLVPGVVLGHDALVHFENAWAITSDASSNAILRLAFAFML